MSKGFLYDNGDEIITREDGAVLPVIDDESMKTGDTPYIDNDGKWAIGSNTVYLPCSYGSTYKRLSFPSDVKGADIKKWVEDGRDIIIVVAPDVTYSDLKECGSMFKALYYNATTEKHYLYLKKALVSVSATDLYFISMNIDVSTINNVATYITIEDADIIHIDLSGNT